MTADVQRELAATEENPLLTEALRYYAERRTMGNPKGWAHVLRGLTVAIEAGVFTVRGVPVSAMQVEEARVVLTRLAEAENRLIADAEKRAAARAIDVVHLEHQREWSRETFGPGDRRKGVLDHIRKELVEIEEAGEHTDEWIDVVILALDGAWRDGYEPAEIIAAIKAKQAKNERRTWPDWRTADPNKAIEHDRALDPSGAAEGAGR